MRRAVSFSLRARRALFRTDKSSRVHVQPNVSRTRPRPIASVIETMRNHPSCVAKLHSERR